MIKRNIERQLEKSVKDFPSVTIYGPRQCGKTTIAKHMFPSFSYANLEDANTRQLAKSDPYEFFTRFPEPVIIDEIQRVPELLSTIQIRIDESDGKKGQYILTGSQQISLKEAIAQSLAGRTSILNMLPLSLDELSNSGIILNRDVQLLAGCMPYMYDNQNIAPSEYYKSYIETYLERDIATQNQVHDLYSFERFLSLLSGRIGQLVNESALALDVGVSIPTIKGWFSILESTHMIYRLRPWYTSRTSQVVKTPKIFFCDTGIAAYLLGIETTSQMTRDPLMGSLFENLIVMEALKAEYDNNIKDSLFFYRNSNGVEVDILQSRPEGLNIYEVKSGQALSKDYLRHINSVKKKFDTNKSGVIYSGEDYPSFMESQFINFHNAYSLFIPEEEPFRLSF